MSWGGTWSHPGVGSLVLDHRGRQRRRQHVVNSPRRSGSQSRRVAAESSGRGTQRVPSTFYLFRFSHCNIFDIVLLYCTCKESRVIALCKDDVYVVSRDKAGVQSRVRSGECRDGVGRVHSMYMEGY